MKSRYVLLPALVVAIALTQMAPAGAQTFTTLHSFNSGNDGASPRAGLLLSGNTLYGTTVRGGNSTNGTVFKVNTDGTGFTVLHSFTATSGSFTNSDGRSPSAGLILLGNTLYGTAASGGNWGSGTIFSVRTNGTGFTVIHNFTATSPIHVNSDGAGPDTRLLPIDEFLYGTTQEGGNWGDGVVFIVRTNGTGFTALHHFTATSGDGANPHGPLIRENDFLYGTTQFGGAAGDGTVFKITTNGTFFSTLHSFVRDSDGAAPYAGLTISGNRLYGTTFIGGNSDSGRVFAVNTDGTGFATLHRFLDYNIEGAEPLAEVILSDNTLYGTAWLGGTGGNGAVFAHKTNGADFRVLHNFTATVSPVYANSDGAEPYAPLVLSGNTLYGATSSGGSSGAGTVFSISLPNPRLTIVRSETNVVIMWPTNLPGFFLQSAADLVAPVSWNTNLPTPVVTSGQYIVTNPISGTQMFYRLAQ